MSDATDDPRLHSILAFTRGDRVAAEELRRTLVLLRDHHPDQRLSTASADVLSGRTTFREMTRIPEVQAALAAGVSSFVDEYAAMSDAEREAMRVAGAEATREIADDLA